MYDWILSILERFKDNKHVLGLLALAVALIIGLSTGTIPTLPVETPTPTETTTVVPTDVIFPTNTIIPTKFATVAFTLTPTLTKTLVSTPTNTVTKIPTIIPSNTPVITTGKIWYIAVNGTSSGDGSQTKPWDSRTGQWDNKAIQPGDTLCFLAGTYDGVGGVRLTDGTAAKPIMVRPCDGAKVTLRRGTSIYSKYVIFTGFEIYYPYTNRVSQEESSHPTDLGYRSTGVSVLADYVKVTNNIIHDMTQGIYVSYTSVGAEVYGNIIYNNGWTAPDRDHGHGIYAQNINTSIPVVLENNVLFNNWGNYNIHVYGEDPILVNMLIKDNITFNGNLLVGGSKSFDQMIITNNFHYGTGYMRLGYSSSAINKTVLVEGNSFEEIRFYNWNNATFKNNRYNVLSYMTSAQPKSISGTEYYPKMGEVVWHKNKYDGSYFVVVFNPEGKAQITLDVPFDKYTITNVQNMSQKQTTNILNMNTFTNLKPLGHSSYIGANTAPFFAVLLVEEG